MREITVRYLPSHLSTELRRILERAANRDVDSDDVLGVWPLERLLEKVYAEGYDDGHLRGDQAARDESRYAQRRAAEEQGKSAGPECDCA